MLDLTFSTEDDKFGEVVTVDLIEDGRNKAVTEENKKEYIKYVKKFINKLINFNNLLMLFI